MKKVFRHWIIISLAAVGVLSSFNKDDHGKDLFITVINEPEMVLTADGSVEEVEIGLFYSGKAVIDWGDGVVDSVSGALINETYTHNYSESEKNKIIKVRGDDVRGLSCEDNTLVDIDVSKNPNLVELDCFLNQLTSLDVSKNLLLDELNCSYNQLTSLDVSKNKRLFGLSCSFNKLSGLDLSANSVLIWLDCRKNQLKSLDLSKNIKLVRLNCPNNQLNADSLNAAFATLHSKKIEKIEKLVYIYGNPGADACNRSIAEANGWKVILNSKMFRDD